MRRLGLVLTASALLLASAPAFAAGGGESGGSSLLWMTFNLLLLFGVLVYFGRKPVRDFFADRREQIHRDVSSAAALRSEVEERFGQWQRKLAELDDEVRRLRATAVERAEAERERILADARAAGERIRTDATAAVAQELRRSREQLREEAADLAVELAADLLRQRVGEDDRSRLLDEFIERVEQTPSNGSPS